MMSSSPTLEPHRHDELHPELDAWRANVGAPVALDVAVDAPSDLQGIDVLCWNLAIGLGQLERLIDRLRAGAFGGAGTVAARPLVILAQEVYREDPSVPHRTESFHHGGRFSVRQRHDIVELAARCGLSVRYSPSMRNGVHPSDRGNAVLSTVRLHDAHAFLLPYVRQRRVVVSAQFAGHARLTFVSAHLDTHGQLRTAPTPLRFAAGRVAQARALADVLARLHGAVIVGADLNTLLGANDPALRELLRAGLEPARRNGSWRHTYHGRFKLLLDHVLYRSVDNRFTRVDVIRLDEAPGDRSSGVFGSDHHPLLARVELAH